MDYALLLAQYARTEGELTKRTAQLSASLPSLSAPAADDVKRRIFLMKEELFDVRLVRLELQRRLDEERAGVRRAAC